VSPGLSQWDFLFPPACFPVVVVVLLAVRAMECCLFVLWLFSFFFFVLTDSCRCKSYVGVTSFEFSGFLLSLDLHGYAGDLVTRPPLCCSLSASVPVDSSSGGVGHPRSERGLHALARVGNVHLSRPSGWCFSGWSAGCWWQGRPECGGWPLTRWSGWFLPLAWRFVSVFSVYSSFISQFAIVVG